MRGLAYNPGILPAEMIIRQRVKPMPSREEFFSVSESKQISECDVAQRRQPVSKIDYQALRAKAEKATCGEWLLEYGEGRFDGDDALIHREAAGYLPICRIEGAHPESGFDEDFQMEQQANAEFITAASPATVLALLDERERNQQYIKRRDQENEDIALTVGKLRVELEAEKQRAKVLFMENARLKSGIAGLIHLGIRYADVEVMKIAGDAQLSTPCTDSIINSIATGIRIKGE